MRIRRTQKAFPPGRLMVAMIVFSGFLAWAWDRGRRRRSVRSRSVLDHQKKSLWMGVEERATYWVEEGELDDVPKHLDEISRARGASSSERERRLAELLLRS